MNRVEGWDGRYTRGILYVGKAQVEAAGVEWCVYRKQRAGLRPTGAGRGWLEWRRGRVYSIGAEGKPRPDRTHTG